MDFKIYLDKTAKELDREVEKILNQELKEAKGIGKKLVPLLEAFTDACMGGKRIRGVLVKLGYELAGKKSKEIIKIGAAYEILHAAILAHDDIIDNSPTRRDKPSLYKSVGISQAITLGDLGFFLAIKIISESNFPQRGKNEALALFARTMVDTAVGQMLDIQKGDPLTIMKFKTAQYTIAGPLQLGAILAGWGPTSIRLRRIKQFGESLGIAFQIQDDILDGEAVDYSQKEALEYTSRAKKLIPKITLNIRLRKLLADMTQYLVERKK